MFDDRREVGHANVHLIADHPPGHVLGTESARRPRALVGLAFGVRFVAIWMAAMGRLQAHINGG